MSSSITIFLKFSLPFTAYILLTAYDSGNAEAPPELDPALNAPPIAIAGNNPNSLPDVARVNGRYRANLINNSKTLHCIIMTGRDV